MLLARPEHSRPRVEQRWIIMAKILLVEDEESMAAPLMEWLESEGHTVEHVMTGEDALQLLINFKYDMIVLDRGLPGLTGGTIPVIFLTGETDIHSKRDGLDSGADDYITKPFEPEELSAGIRAVLRRPAALIPDVLKIANVELNAKTQKVSLEGENIALSKKEYAVLEFLMRNPSRCFSSQELIATIWRADAEGTEDAVRSCFKRLRRKLADKDGNCIVSTIHGAGYTIEG